MSRLSLVGTIRARVDAGQMQMPRYLQRRTTLRRHARSRWAAPGGPRDRRTASSRLTRFSAGGEAWWLAWQSSFR